MQFGPSKLYTIQILSLNLFITLSSNFVQKFYPKVSDIQKYKYGHNLQNANEILTWLKPNIHDALIHCAKLFSIIIIIKLF